MLLTLPKNAQQLIAFRPTDLPPKTSAHVPKLAMTFPVGQGGLDSPRGARERRPWCGTIRVIMGGRRRFPGGLVSMPPTVLGSMSASPPGLGDAGVRLFNFVDYGPIVLGWSSPWLVGRSRS